MKKKILSLCLVAALALTAIGGTLAYFTDTDEVNNVMTMGDLDILLDEAKVTKDTEDDIWTAGKERVDGNDYGQVYPGAVLPKDPTIHNEGEHDAYVWATVNVSNWMNICAELNIDCDIASLNKLIGNTLGEGWEVIAVENGDTFTIGQFDAKFVLKYEARLAAGDDTTAMFKEITVPVEFESGKDYLFGKIDVVAYAIQAEGFADWDAAYVAYYAE